MGGKQQSKEPCKKEACDIQACLTKNNFNPQRTRRHRNDIRSGLPVSTSASQRKGTQVFKDKNSCTDNSEIMTSTAQWRKKNGKMTAKKPLIENIIEDNPHNADQLIEEFLNTDQGSLTREQLITINYFSGLHSTMRSARSADATDSKVITDHGCGANDGRVRLIYRGDKIITLPSTHSTEQLGVARECGHLINDT